MPLKKVKINFSICFSYCFTNQHIFAIFQLYSLEILSHILLDDVGYGPWSLWGECDVPCGLGTRVRQRICPKKRNCAKEGVQQTETCAANFCPIDGGII